MGAFSRWLRWRGPYLRWKLAHPRGRFRDWYLSRVERRIEDGEVHETLGARSVEREGFHETGALMFERLRREGLGSPTLHVVDYGCGSLRVGRHVIQYLAPRRYVGLDLTDRFFSEGLGTMLPEVVAEKAPEFGVLAEEEIARRAARPADLLYSTSVVTHVPRAEIDEYFSRLRRLVKPGGKVLVTFYDDARHRPVDDLTWTWPGGEILAVGERHGLRGDSVTMEELALPEGMGCVNSLLRLRAA